MFRNFAKSVVAIAAMTMVPVAATASSVAPLSVAAGVRSDAQLQGESNQFEDATQYIIPIVIVIAIGLGLYFALEEDDEDGASV